MNYKEIVTQVNQNKLLLGIDPAVARQFFTESNPDFSLTNFHEKISRERTIVKTIWISQFISLLLLFVVSVLQFGWYSFAIIPLSFFLFFFYSGKASMGSQSLIDIIAIGIVSILIAYLFKSNGFWFITFFLIAPTPFVFVRLTYRISVFYMRKIALQNESFFNHFYEKGIFIK